MDTNNEKKCSNDNLESKVSNLHEKELENVVGGVMSDNPDKLPGYTPPQTPAPLKPNNTGTI